nr:hypothetical protein CFP56_03688 [Quercus suber]
MARAKEETTMLAESHWSPLASVASVKLILVTHHGRNIQICPETILVRLVVVLRNVVVDAALEHEVFGERDTLVDGEPVPDEVHEVLQGLFEVAVAGDGDGDVDGRGDAGPDEAGDALGPASQDLHGERDGVDVGAVVGDNGQREDDEAELAEGADVGDENFAEKTAGAGG